jgi:hypothetical protein
VAGDSDAAVRDEIRERIEASFSHAIGGVVPRRLVRG